MKFTLITFIIPVYNAEKTLERCVNSILTLDRDDYEIILVDDGSKDASGKICDEYADKYDNIKVIHQKNQGQAAARNSGLKAANGQYILFCDSDDWYSTDLLIQLLGNLCDNNKIILSSNISINGVENGRYVKNALDITDNISFCTTRSSHNSLGYAIWNKIYLTGILQENSISFFERNVLNNKDDWCEDLFFNLQYFLMINSVNQTGLPVYCLQTHDKSEEQLNKELGTRITHMFNLFSALKETKVYQNISFDDFSKIFVWHIRRTFYDYLKVHTIEEARKDIFSHYFGKEAIKLIKARLSDRKYFYERYDDKQAEDYINLLSYFVTGNKMIYKFKSMILWKIKEK